MIQIPYAVVLTLVESEFLWGSIQAVVGIYVLYAWIRGLHHGDISYMIRGSVAFLLVAIL